MSSVLFNEWINRYFIIINLIITSSGEWSLRNSLIILQK